MCCRIEDGERAGAGEVCEFPVYSTSDSSEDGASDLDKLVARCPHVPPAPPAGAERHLAEAAAALDDADRLMDAIVRLTAGAGRRERAVELLAMTEERMAEAAQALDEDPNGTGSIEAEVEAIFDQAAQEDFAGTAESEAAARDIAVLAPLMSAVEGDSDDALIRDLRGAHQRGVEAASELLDDAGKRLVRVTRNRPEKRHLQSRLLVAGERLAELAAILTTAQAREQPDR